MTTKSSYDELYKRGQIIHVKPHIDIEEVAEGVWNVSIHMGKRWHHIKRFEGTKVEARNAACAKVLRERDERGCDVKKLRWHQSRGKPWLRVLPQKHFVTTDLSRIVSKDGCVGVDVEMWNREACLVQVSGQHGTALVHPADKELRALLQNPFVTKLFCDVSADLKLFEDMGITVMEYCDIQDEAEKLWGLPFGVSRWGLCTIWSRLNHTKFTKPKYIQCSNWSQRPLSPEQIQYAATDSYTTLHAGLILLERLGNKKQGVPYRRFRRQKKVGQTTRPPRQQPQPVQ